jgi:hypothetical protein
VQEALPSPTRNPLVQRTYPEDWNAPLVGGTFEFTWTLAGEYDLAVTPLGWRIEHEVVARGKFWASVRPFPEGENVI